MTTLPSPVRGGTAGGWRSLERRSSARLASEALGGFVLVASFLGLLWLLSGQAVLG